MSAESQRRPRVLLPPLPEPRLLPDELPPNDPREDDEEDDVPQLWRELELLEAGREVEVDVPMLRFEFEGVVVMLPRPRLMFTEVPVVVEDPGCDVAVPGVTVPG